MNKTKYNNTKSRHYELKIRTITQDTVDFISYVIENRYYKFKRAKYVIMQIIVGVILFFASVTVSVFLNELGISQLVRLIFTVCAGFAIVKTIVSLMCPFPKITKEEAIESIIATTSPYKGETERIIFYNLGEKGFSTDSCFHTDVMFYEYGVFNRVIECELGIIMMLDEVYTYCIPARYFNDETACFIVEKFKKACGKKFITTGKMKIGS